jgi:hypothetical protein
MARRSSRESMLSSTADTRNGNANKEENASEICDICGGNMKDSDDEKSGEKSADDDNAPYDKTTTLPEDSDEPLSSPMSSARLSEPPSSARGTLSKKSNAKVTATDMIIIVKSITVISIIT